MIKNKVVRWSFLLERECPSTLNLDMGEETFATREAAIKFANYEGEKNPRIVKITVERD